MSENKEIDTEKLILDAAMKVFTAKGFAAARTVDIAKEAGINRALLHYYFRDKETMFNMIFETRFKEFFGGVFKIFSSEESLFEKIKQLIEHELGTFMKHPDLARFIIIEVASKPERLIEQGQKHGLNPRVFLEKFEAQVKKEVKDGNIKPIEGRQLLMNIMSLCIYPFVAQQIIRVLMQLDRASFMTMMEVRKKEIYDFIMNAIKP